MTRKSRTWQGKPELHFQDLKTLILECTEKFKAEPTLLKVNYPVMIVGEIHGQYKDLERILALPTAKDADVAQNVKRILFLGNYVDRGSASIPCLITLMRLKVKHPKRYGLLGGKHEAEAMNGGRYGFKAELAERYKRIGEQNALFRLINDMFAYLPLAALVGKRILCMHGGISPHLTSLEAIDQIKRPISNIFSFPLAGDLLCSDPRYIDTDFRPNTIQRASFCFSEKAVQDTCKRLNLDFIILAHQDSKAAVMVITKKKEMGFAFLGPNKSDKLSTDKEFKEKFGYLDKLQQAEDIGRPPNPDRSEDTKGNDSNSASLNDSFKPKEVKKVVYTIEKLYN
ncbi:unnamed protein product [Bursaphelenchus okinawaensis]|uniref:protein-serine/threonine phosphatase n=1 Tax=Bursaphelenchus okinawaensis TaxID=465554 RepID=A0A811KLR9_9BILA|nr:unnamed protein product [Bursaphelenchus okinawaensis]CAG9107563.1 unnamed protein product [Bursaphelenchus okinawaensis]